MTESVRKYVAEFIGTTILVFFAVGSAVFGINSENVGQVGVALTFGLTLLALAYSIGPISGCHVNPAVTLGLLLRKGITPGEAAGYWIAQFLGGILGAAGLQLMVSGGDVKDQTGALGTNNWGPNINMGGDFLLEVILTFLLVLVVLMVTHRAAAPGFAGLAIGLVLAAIHFVGIPLDGTGVNPARSLGPALFNGGQSLTHVWLYIVAPLVGAVLAALVAPIITAPPAGPGIQRDETGADVPAQPKSRRAKTA